MAIRTFCGLIFLAFFSACGGGGGSGTSSDAEVSTTPDQGTANIEVQPYVEIPVDSQIDSIAWFFLDGETEQRPSGDVTYSTLSAEFHEFDDGVSTNMLQNLNSMLRPVDTAGCFTYRSKSGYRTTEQLHPRISNLYYGVVGYEYISAGPELKVNSIEGEWPSLVNYDLLAAEGHYVIQSVDDRQENRSFKGWLKLGSTISIPGETFPKSDDLAIQSAEPITGFSSSASLENFTSADTLQWDSPTTNSEFLLVTFVFSNNVGGLESDLVQYSWFNCMTEDSGVFHAPADLQHELANPASRVEYLHMARFAERAIQTDNRLLIYSSRTNLSKSALWP